MPRSRLPCGDSGSNQEQEPPRLRQARPSAAGRAPSGVIFSTRTSVPPAVSSISVPSPQPLETDLIDRRQGYHTLIQAMPANRRVTRAPHSRPFAARNRRRKLTSKDLDRNSRVEDTLMTAYITLPANYRPEASNAGLVTDPNTIALPPFVDQASNAALTMAQPRRYIDEAPPEIVRLIALALDSPLHNKLAVHTVQGREGAACRMRHLL